MLGSVAAEFASGREDEMLLALEAKKFGRWRNVESVPVGIVGRAQFRTVRLRAADAGHYEVFLMSESVLSEVWFHFAVHCTVNGTVLPLREHKSTCVDGSSLVSSGKF